MFEQNEKTKVITVKCSEKGCNKSFSNKTTTRGATMKDAKGNGWVYKNADSQLCPAHAPAKKAKVEKKAKKAAVKPAKKAKPSKVAKVKKAKVTTKGKKTTKTSIPPKKSATTEASSTTPKTSRSDLLSAAGQPSTTAPEQKDGATE